MLGALSRENKREGLVWSDILAAWSVRLTDEEKVAISKVCYDKGHKSSRKITVAEAVDYAVEKCFSKNSVVPANALLEQAMRVGVGQVTPEMVRQEMLRRELLVREVKGELLCTSVPVLAEEVALVSFVRAGRRRMAPLGGNDVRLPKYLSSEQERAVRLVLESNDQVVGIEGRAGAGKTTALTELRTALEAAGKRVYAFAPSAAASRGTLQESGFENAETVAHLLANQALLAKVRGQVVIIDEAGQVGVSDLLRVMEALGPSTRFILTGDTRQHTPVSRGDAFRILLTYSGMLSVAVTEIRRQEVELYRGAIEALSKGDLRTGFGRLDALGAFIEIKDETERYRALGDDYVSITREGTAPLVVSPTHREGAKVTDAIRQALREARMLGTEREFIRYHNLQWEEADRGRPESYSSGLMVQYNQNGKGVVRGAQFRVRQTHPDGRVEVLDSKGKPRILNLEEKAKFDVYEGRKIALAKGDTIRITKNGNTDDGRRINNGTLFSVAGFDRKGRIVLNTGGVLSPEHGHFSYGYCITSHSAQSKTVRDVLVAQSEDSFVASSSAQFYVSASRGKQTIRIYTDSRAGLQQAVGNSASRMSALELAKFTRSEFDSMSEALNRDRWREALERRRKPAWQDNVKTRSGLDKTKTFVQNVMEERRGRAAKKGEVVSWKAYVEMKRSMAGPDGKNRSKGHPSPEKKKGRVNGALIKRSEHRTPTQERMKAVHEAKKAEIELPPPANDNSRKAPTARFKAAAKSGAEHFKSVMSRGAKPDAAAKRAEIGKRQAKTAEKISQPPSQKTQIDRAAQQQMRQKRQERQQQQQPAKVQTPVVRRGR